MRSLRNGWLLRFRPMALLGAAVLLTASARSHRLEVEPVADAAVADAAVVDASWPHVMRPPDGGLNDCVGAVYFEDPTLEAGVRAALGIDASQPLDAASMLELTELRFERDDSSAKLFSLLGLECALNLSVLSDANGGSISDLSPLEPLSLSGVYLRNHKISSLDPLSDMPALWIVDFGNNQISDIGPIAIDVDFGLLYLALDGNRIEDLTPFLELGFGCAQIDVTDNPLSTNSVTSVIPEVCDKLDGTGSGMEWSGGSCGGVGCILTR